MIVRFGKSGERELSRKIFPRFDALCPPNFVLHSIVRNRILSSGVGSEKRDREKERKKEKYNRNGDRDRGNQKGRGSKKGGK